MNKKTLLISLLLVLVMGLLPGMAIADDVAGEAQATSESEAVAAVQDDQDAEATDQVSESEAANLEAAEPEVAVEPEPTKAKPAKVKAAADPEPAKSGKAKPEAKQEEKGELSIQSYEYAPWDGGDVAGILTLDGPVVVSTDGDGEFYSFTPGEDGYYRFFSSNNDGDPAGCIYDAEGESLANGDDEEIPNFSFGASLEGGVTYCILHA